MAEIPCAVVGTKFRGRDAMKAIGLMKPGDPVRLDREAHNQHDSNAVAVYYLSLHVGYLPRQANPRIAAAMDAGITPAAVVEITPIVRGNWIDREPRILVSWSD